MPYLKVKKKGTALFTVNALSGHVDLASLTELKFEETSHLKVCSLRGGFFLKLV